MPKPQKSKSILADASNFPPDWHYERSVDQIESIIQCIEAGDSDLAEVFTQFESAVAEIRRCETFLTERQNQVDLLIETLVDQDS